MERPERVRREIIRTLTAAGYNEAITFSFVDAHEAAEFGWAEPVAVDAAVRKTNNALRPTHWPSLLRAIKGNQDVGNEDVELFELAAVFPPAGGSELPAEHMELALAGQGELRDLRGALEAVVERIAPQAQLQVCPAKVSGLEEAASAEILLDGQSVGALGQVAASIQRRYGLEKAAMLGRIDADALLSRAQLVRTAHPLPKFPPVRRDLSVILPESTTWGEIAAAIEDVPQPLRTNLEYVTTYRGKPVPKGKKSLTLALEYRSTSATLTSEQVDEQVEQIVAKLAEKFSAELRTA
jgi:phenylalanyl-tRNA synthetase beta chain